MGSSQGVLRGCGHQHLTAVFNFIGETAKAVAAA